MNIYIPKDINHLPFLDRSFRYINPTYLLNPTNYEKFSGSISTDTLHKLRFGYYVGLGCSYPRFDLSTYFYKIESTPNLNILPDSTPVYVDFDHVTDIRSCDLLRRAVNYEHVYLFWSGGIDSTLVLCSLLKNWDSVSLSKLIVVANSHSIAEYPEMYYLHIHNKFREVSTDEFFSGNVKLTNNSLYVTGDTGDPLFGYGPIYEFDMRYPGVYQKPWRQNIDILLEYFSGPAGKVAGNFAMDHIIDSLSLANIQVDTVYDFLWWIDFNWGYDFDLYYLCWLYSELPPTVDAKKFVEDNTFPFFNCKLYQNWAITTIGTNKKIGEDVSTHKLSAKRYIFDYTRDHDYFHNKRKESSTPKNIQVEYSRRIMAVDTSYNLYFTEPNVWHKEA